MFDGPWSKLNNVQRLSSLRVRSKASVAVALLVFAAPNTAHAAAQFESEQSVEHGAWAVHLFRNKSSGRRFCALQAESAGVTLRVNRYQDNAETFLEVYSPSWTMMEGGLRFQMGSTLEVRTIAQNYSASHGVIAIPTTSLNPKNMKRFSA
jgi:hypothetical protein